MSVKNVGLFIKNQKKQAGKFWHFMTKQNNPWLTFPRLFTIGLLVLVLVLFVKVVNTVLRSIVFVFSILDWFIPQDSLSYWFNNIKNPKTILQFYEKNKFQILDEW